ncbi:glycoside hydrolase [Panus rudis PR-1116 ss-1]|nr:glycoside hydrolase [Panus rudis PR-1116 ss-1]
MLYMLSLLTLLPSLATVWAVPTNSPLDAAISSNPTNVKSLIARDTSNSSISRNLVSMTWYAGWHGTNDKFPLTKVSWKKYTHISYAFGVTQANGSISLEASNQPLFGQFVKEARRNHVKPMLTIGGWTGCQWFSTSVGSAKNRTAFVQTMIDLMHKYDLEGLDFDWEYPGKQGMGCNIVDEANDTNNFLLFLQALRATPEFKNRLITAAVTDVPFAIKGNPATDVSGFAKVLDWVEVMNYDAFGAWSKNVGPNAALNDTCAPKEQQVGSAVSAVKTWTAAGMPANKLVLGVASYGHSFSVSESDAYASSSSSSKRAPSANQTSASSGPQPSGTKLLAPFPKFDNTASPPGDAWDPQGDATGTDQCGNPITPQSGVWNFFALIDEGYLDSKGTVSSQKSLGFRFDECSQTPYVYDPKNKTLITYDDPKSFAAKGKFIHDSKMRGFAMWEAAGDKNDLLLDSIRSAMGA